MVFSSNGLRHLMAECGASKIMVGTDYNFGWVTDPVGHILNTPGVSDADKVAMLGGNAGKLLKL
jgi:aminocarboxymuconate-semialdehyde decarboxylase